MKSHTCPHGALWEKLDTCSRLIFQKLIRIYYWTENGICYIAEAEIFNVHGTVHR